MPTRKHDDTSSSSEASGGDGEDSWGGGSSAFEPPSSADGCTGDAEGSDEMTDEAVAWLAMAVARCAENFDQGEYGRLRLEYEKTRTRVPSGGDQGAV